MTREDWVVGDKGIRPAGKTDECFYCSRKRGEQHKENCVIRCKTVVCELNFRVVRVVPEYWSKDDIEFHMNESSWCANNALRELGDLSKRVGCLCDFFKGKYIREADSRGEERNNIKVNELPS